MDSHKVNILSCLQSRLWAQSREDPAYIFCALDFQETYRLSSLISAGYPGWETVLRGK